MVVAHVGDSRAYLLRDGDLIRLTRDHSLVDELIRRGKLTEEQAESHPQRSVITRALGPEPNVEVDVEAFPARAGDVFLLCSDGLTSMVHEPKLKPLLTDRDRSLEQTGRALIAAANEAGGRDNITVILFRLEEVDDRRPADEAAVTAEYDTFAGEAAAAPGRHQADAGDGRRRGGVPPARHGRARRPSARGPSRTRRRRRAPERTMPLPGNGKPGEAPPQALGRHDAPAAGDRPAAVRRRLARHARRLLRRHRGGRRPAWSRSTAACRTSCRSGSTSTSSGTRPASRSRDVPAARREGLIDHKLRSRDDAEDLVIALEKGQVE